MTVQCSHGGALPLTSSNGAVLIDVLTSMTLVLFLISAAQLLHAATFGAHHAAALAAVHRIFQGRHQARGQALYSAAGFGAGGALGMFASGWLWNHAGTAWTFTCGAAAALIAWALVAGRLRIPEPAPAAA